MQYFTRKELKDLGISGAVVRINNLWYFRAKGSETWVKIGKSEDKEENFQVPWDPAKVEPHGQEPVAPAVRRNPPKLRHSFTVRRPWLPAKVGEKRASRNPRSMHIGALKSAIIDLVKRNRQP